LNKNNTWHNPCTLNPVQPVIEKANGANKMNAGKTSTKFLLTLGAMISVVVAGTFSDLRFNSNDFMFNNEITTEVHYEETSNRIVASAESELASAQYIAFNVQNKLSIDGDWRITKIYNTDESVVYDQNRRKDKGLVIEVTLEMIATSLVRIDGDKGLDFDISLLHESGTRIALFRSMGKGYEIIEAKKYTRRAKVQNNELANDRKKAKKKKVSPKKVVKSKGGVNLDRDVDLILERALDPKKNKDVLMGENISGSVSLLGGNIENLEITIHRGTDKEVSQSVPFIQVNTGGQFSFEAEDGQIVSGILTNNGKDGYRVRFATGVFAGAMLNFVTQEEFDKLEELHEKIEYDKMVKQEEIDAEREANATQAEVEVKEDMSQERAKYDNYEKEQEENIKEIESEEEMVLKVKNSGFNFARGRSLSNRKPASIK
jgi:hypothetical protein